MKDFEILPDVVELCSSWVDTLFLAVPEKTTSENINTKRDQFCIMFGFVPVCPKVFWGECQFFKKINPAGAGSIDPALVEQIPRNDSDRCTGKLNIWLLPGQKS